MELDPPAATGRTRTNLRDALDGILFMTLEHESTVVNLFVRPEIYQRFPRAAPHSVLVMARGKVERQRLVVHALVDRIEGLRMNAETISQRSRDFW